jgi:hypothetical protein
MIELSTLQRENKIDVPTHTSNSSLANRLTYRQKCRPIGLWVGLLTNGKTWTLGQPIDKAGNSLAYRSTHLQTG